MPCSSVRTVTPTGQKQFFSSVSSPPASKTSAIRFLYDLSYKMNLHPPQIQLFISFFIQKRLWNPPRMIFCTIFHIKWIIRPLFLNHLYDISHKINHPPRFGSERAADRLPGPNRREGRREREAAGINGFPPRSGSVCRDSEQYTNFGRFRPLSNRNRRHRSPDRSRRPQCRLPR